MMVFSWNGSSVTKVFTSADDSADNYNNYDTIEPVNPDIPDSMAELLMTRY